MVFQCSRNVHAVLVCTGGSASRILPLFSTDGRCGQCYRRTRGARQRCAGNRTRDVRNTGAIHPNEPRLARVYARLHQTRRGNTCRRRKTLVVFFPLSYAIHKDESRLGHVGLVDITREAALDTSKAAPAL